jgi:hypothetical protein
MTDFLTGRVIADTDDERLIQHVARFLVARKMYGKEDVERKRRIEFDVEGKKVFSMVDLVVKMAGRIVIAIKYGPGSLVTRERPALAIARILEPYMVPLTVVTNGEEAELLDTASGKVIASGLDSIPDKASISGQFGKFTWGSLRPRQIEAEKRILSAYDYLEHSLECDDDWCAQD